MPTVKTELLFLQITFTHAVNYTEQVMQSGRLKSTAGPINLCYKTKGSKQGTEFGPSARLEREHLFAVMQSTCQPGLQRHSMRLSPTA